MSKRIDDLKTFIERGEKCRAKHVLSEPIREDFRGNRVWEGVVETFALDDHPTAKRAYAWVVPASVGEEAEYRYSSRCSADKLRARRGQGVNFERCEGAD